MPDPARLTAAQLVALFDGTPRATAAELLRSGRILKAREVVTLCRIVNGGPIMHSHFARLVEHIGRRWTSERALHEAHTGRTSSESTSTCMARSGASAPDGPGSSPPLRMAGETSTLPAITEEEWRFTCRRRDGRIIVEEKP